MEKKKIEKRKNECMQDLFQNVGPQSKKVAHPCFKSNELKTLKALNTALEVPYLNLLFN